MHQRGNPHAGGVAPARARPGTPADTPAVRVLLLQAVTRHVARHAHQLAHEVGARAVVLCADVLGRDEELHWLLQAVRLPAILVTRGPGGPPPPGCESATWVRVPDVHMSRAGQVKVALLACLARGILRHGDRVVCLTGIDGSGTVDALLVLNLGTECELFSSLEVLGPEGDVQPGVFERALALATELAVEGREGRPIGALFVVGDSERVLAQSRNLVLNPFLGHPEAERNLLDPTLEETIKGFATLDGAFVVRGDGVVLTAGAQLVPEGSPGPLPRGLGTRHAAAAAITASTDALALVISQSTGIVSVFKAGRIITAIHKGATGSQLPL
jgi:hypothetical protein